MDHQPPAPPPERSLFELNLDASNSYTLRSAASWAKVTGVVGIILGIIFIIIAVMALSQTSDRYGSRRSEGFNDLFTARGSAGLGAAIIIITGVIFVLGGIFSINFGNKINIALKTNDQLAMNAGFSGLRNYYALRTIVLIIVLLLFLISFASAL